jgi:DNA-directed RNA polymerase specialized sigma24 family protein
MVHVGLDLSRTRLDVHVMALTGSSSKQQSLVSRLAAAQPALVASATDRQQRPPTRQRQTQHRLSVEQVQRLVAEYRDGASVQELAARWGVHRTTVAAQLRQAGVPLRRRGVPADRRTEAIRLYGEGWSCQRLAERYGCHATTVWKVLRQAGVRLRAPWERA